MIRKGQAGADEGPLVKKIEKKSRNSWRENGGRVGAYGQLIYGANLNKSYNQIKTLKSFLSHLLGSAGQTLVKDCKSFPHSL